MKALVGERLMAVQEHLGDDEYFLANYADGLSDAPLDLMIENLISQGKIASLLQRPSDVLVPHPHRR